MCCFVYQAVKIKKKLRESAEAENLIPKKDTDFYHDHIDVIVRENYISSDSEEEELARKIKTARLRTANKGSQQGTGRLDTSPSRSGSAGMNASTGGAGTLKLPSIQSR